MRNCSCYFCKEKLNKYINIIIITVMAQELEPHILKKFQILQKLGKGAYGVVWKAIDKQTKQIVALKKVFDAFQNATDAQRTYREVIFLQQLNGHPNIVSLFSIIKAQNNKDVYLVFDFMETDLYAVIRAKIMENIHKRYVLYQVLKGIKYMHTGELIHRDLKPSNILLDSDCLAKLADFGLARSIASVNQAQNEPVMTEYVATRWYRAPQILLGSNKYTKAVDIWSIGCILGQMYLQKAIFPGHSTLNQIQRIIQLLGRPTRDQIQSMESVMAQQFLNQIVNIKKKAFSSAFPSMDQLALDLMKKMLTFNPNARISVQQALRHPYFKDFHNEQDEISFNGIIQIGRDQNTKYSIKQYRQALYKEVTKKKQKQPLKKLNQSNQIVNMNSSVQQKRKQDQRKEQQRQKQIKRNQYQQQLKKQQQQFKRMQQVRQNRRDSYKKREGLSKQNSNYQQSKQKGLIKPSQKSHTTTQGNRSFYLNQKQIKYTDKISVIKRKL